MKALSILLFLILTSCRPAADSSAVIPDLNKKDQPNGVVMSECDEYKPIEIPKSPSAVARMDFLNGEYPIVEEAGNVKLSNGCYTKVETEGLGEITYTLDAVRFVDFDGDGSDEALVTIGNFGGGVSSAASDTYFVYREKNGKTELIWKFAEGARAYCGPREFAVEGKTVLIEVFSNCESQSDGTLKDNGKHTYDYSAFEYTKFKFGWSGNRIGTLSREVFPYPEKEIKDYKRMSEIRP